MNGWLRIIKITSIKRRSLKFLLFIEKCGGQDFVHPILKWCKVDSIFWLQSTRYVYYKKEEMRGLSFQSFISRTKQIGLNFYLLQASLLSRQQSWVFLEEKGRSKQRNNKGKKKYTPKAMVFGGISYHWKHLWSSRRKILTLAPSSGQSDPHPWNEQNIWFKKINSSSGRSKTTSPWESNIISERLLQTRKKLTHQFSKLYGTADAVWYTPLCQRTVLLVSIWLVFSKLISGIMQNQRGNKPHML